MTAPKQPRSAKSVREFCESYGISPPTVYNEIATGRLRTIKIGRRRLITVDQEREWLARAEREAQAA